MSVLQIDQLEEVDLPVIDVRSPGEFQRGHIPGAANVPLFDDLERAEIGTLYKQVGREQAVTRGLEIGNQKADQLIQSVRRVAGKQAFVVHCWRGGMRSQGVAWLCEDCGLKPNLLQGGYKAFRRAAHQGFQQPQQVLVLAGQTGSGKTLLLDQLRRAGQQVIDLEALAVHRGSVFGGFDGRPQPTVEQFENDLFVQWRALDPSRPVWIEGESRTIGKVIIPDSIWHQMSEAHMVFVEVDREPRIEFLLQDYGDLPGEQLIAAAERIRKRLGGARLQAAIEAVERDDRRGYAGLVLEYYDKSYSKALARRDPDTVSRLPMSESGDPNALPELLSLADRLAGSVGGQRSGSR